MKPLPVPRGTCCTLAENISRCVASVVMCTTDGPMRLKTSMWATSSAASGPRAATARGDASVRLYEVRRGHNRAAAVRAPSMAAMAMRQVEWGRRFIVEPSGGFTALLPQPGQKPCPWAADHGFCVAFRRAA